MAGEATAASVLFWTVFAEEKCVITSDMDKLVIEAAGWSVEAVLSRTGKKSLLLKTLRYRDQNNVSILRTHAEGLNH